MKAIWLIFVPLLVGCAPGQNGPTTVYAYESCVNVYVSGNPVGGTPTTTLTVPMSGGLGGLPIPGIRGEGVAAAAPVPGQSCAINKRDSTIFGAASH